MSETTKNNLKAATTALTNASMYVADATQYASVVGDKVLTEKIAKVKLTIKETSEYIASRTGSNS